MHTPPHPPYELRRRERTRRKEGWKLEQEGWGDGARRGSGSRGRVWTKWEALPSRHVSRSNTRVPGYSRPRLSLLCRVNPRQLQSDGVSGAPRSVRRSCIPLPRQGSFLRVFFPTSAALFRRSMRDRFPSRVRTLMSFLSAYRSMYTAASCRGFCTCFFNVRIVSLMERFLLFWLELSVKDVCI